MSRSESREAAFMLLFENMFRNEDPDDIIDTAVVADLFDISDDADKLFRSVWEKRDELAAVIDKYSEKRQFSRIPKVSAAVLEIAIYESLYDDKVPVNVAISEAVILAKKYAMEPDVKFVNGLLSSLAGDIAKKEDK